jgi:hypothetical protein
MELSNIIYQLFLMEFIHNFTRSIVDNLLKVEVFLAVGLLPYKETTYNNHKVWSKDQRQ